MDDDQPQGTTHGRGRKSTVTEGMRLSGHQEEWLDQLPILSKKFLERHRRPLVTVSYAQSVDGSIATSNREPLQLSSRQSMVLTHRIRRACDAIVIGINTLIADNPLLTVRLVDGASPQPIVLDSNLRIPMQAHLLDRTDHHCWLACSDKNSRERVRAVESRGADVIRCHPDHLGRVNLPALLHLLGERGIRSIMVEGGGQVITSFIEARLVDQMIITIAPRLVGGLPVLHRPVVENGARLHLDSVSYLPCGPDIILWAKPQWQKS
ncbi:MAG: RibD family protein [Desulforhopalus sp.]